MVVVVDCMSMILMLGIMCDPAMFCSEGKIGRAKCWLVKLVGWLVVVVDGIPRKDPNRSLSKVGKGNEWGCCLLL